MLSNRVMQSKTAIVALRRRFKARLEEQRSPSSVLTASPQFASSQSGGAVGPAWVRQHFPQTYGIDLSPQSYAYTSHAESLRAAKPRRLATDAAATRFNWFSARTKWEAAPANVLPSGCGGQEPSVRRRPSIPAVLDDEAWPNAPPATKWGASLTARSVLCP